MKIFFFIDCNDQYRIVGIQQFFGNLQPFLYEGKPFTMTIFIVAVDVVVVIFPIPGAGIVRRVDVDTIHLACVQIFQKL